MRMIYDARKMTKQSGVMQMGDAIHPPWLSLMGVSLLEALIMMDMFTSTPQGARGEHLT
jgi:hypothetical protein